MTPPADDLAQANFAQGPLRGPLSFSGESVMTSRKAKSRKSTVKAAAIKPAVAKSSPVPASSNPVLVVLGYGDRQTPQGARFDGTDRDLVAKAADLMGLNLYQATSPEAVAAAENLPAGRLYATGRGFVPNIR